MEGSSARPAKHVHVRASASLMRPACQLEANAGRSRGRGPTDSDRSGVRFLARPFLFTPRSSLSLSIALTTTSYGPFLGLAYFLHFYIGGGLLESKLHQVRTLTGSLDYYCCCYPARMRRKKKEDQAYNSILQNLQNSPSLPFGILYSPTARPKSLEPELQLICLISSSSAPWARSTTPSAAAAPRRRTRRMARRRPGTPSRPPPP